MNKRIQIGQYLTIEVPPIDPTNLDRGYDYGGCCITSNLERCQPEKDDDIDETESKLMFNGAMDAVESLVLSLASAGVDVENAAFATAVQSTLDALANNL